MINEKLSLKTVLTYQGLGAGINLPLQIAFLPINFYNNFTLGLDPVLTGIAWLLNSI